MEGDGRGPGMVTKARRPTPLQQSWNAGIGFWTVSIRTGHAHPTETVRRVPVVRYDGTLEVDIGCEASGTVQSTTGYAY